MTSYTCLYVGRIKPCFVINDMCYMQCKNWHRRDFLEKLECNIKKIFFYKLEIWMITEKD